MHYKILSFVYILLSSFQLLSQDFSAVQKEVIATQTDELLRNYRNYGSFTEDGRNISVLFLNRFSNLFTNTSNVYVHNDIDPEKTMAEYITVGEYILKVQSWFIAGLDINLTWNLALISDPVLTGPGNTYSVSILAEKQLMGIYKGKKIHKAANDLYFIIEFKRNKSELTQFKISGIQKGRPELKPYQEKTVIPVVKKSNVSLSVFFEPTYTRIYSQSMYTDEYWKASGRQCYAAGMGLTIHVSNYIDLLTGLGLGKYSTTMKLDTFVNHSNTTLLEDKDEDLYYRYIEAGNIDEIDALTYMEIPLGIGYNQSLGKKMSLFAQTGVNFSLLLIGKYKVTGYSSHTGYYPEYHVLLYELPEYDFTTGNVDKEDDWKVSPINISAFIKVGCAVKITDVFSLQMGPVFTMGLTDLKYDTPKHRDDFVSTVGLPGKTTLQGGGFNLALTVKL